MNAKPTHLDLFSGIGGFSIAFEAEGFQTIGFSEIDPYACRVLKRHWPNIINYGDIKNVKGVSCDIVTGGFPCQPFSLAGKRRGASDDRALWPQMRRVIAECRPRWVLGENVPGIISMELDSVLSDLENLGYSAWPIAVPACAVDARHRRERIWIVAHSRCINGRSRSESGRPGIEASNSSQAAAHSERSGYQQRHEHEMQRRRKEESQQARLGSFSLADTNQPGSQGRDGEVLRECSSERIAGKGGSSVSDSDSVNGWSGTGRENREKVSHGFEWLPEPELGRVANGIPNRSHRLKGLGNSIVPQVAQVFARAIFSLTPFR